MIKPSNYEGCGEIIYSERRLDYINRMPQIEVVGEEVLELLQITKDSDRKQNIL